MIGNRIVVDHVYHAIDYDTVWRTLVDDVPALDDVVRRWARGRGLLHPYFDRDGIHPGTRGDAPGDARGGCRRDVHTLLPVKLLTNGSR